LITIKTTINLKNIFTTALLILMGTGFLTLQSCQKTETIKDLTSYDAGKNSSGGGGTSGSGHNGGGSTTTTPAPTDSSLAPADTTTSPLPVADIITVGRWKITSFVQGNDNLTSQFATYAFTFNSDGSMIADESGNQTIGTWRYQDAIFYYGIPVYGSSPYGFTMTIGTQLPLIELDKNFFISKKTLTTIYIDSINPNENAHITLSRLAQ
jgi:hypothetical protein